MEQQKRLPTPKKSAILNEVRPYATGPLPPYGTLTRIAREVGVSDTYVGLVLKELRGE